MGRPNLAKRNPMSLSYRRIRKHPRTFKRLFGIQVPEFERILKAAEPLWNKWVLGRYKRPGRHYS
jgi:hypothetical protein